MSRGNPENPILDSIEVGMFFACLAIVSVGISQSYNGEFSGLIGVFVGALGAYKLGRNILKNW